MIVEIPRALRGSQNLSKFGNDAEQFPEITCEEHPDWIDLCDQALKYGLENLERPQRPGWLPQLSCMPGEGKVWQWDSCFMSFFARYSGGVLPGMNNLDNLYRLQREDGFLAMSYLMETEEPAYGERINPPLLAWAEWDYYTATGDDSRFERVLPKLLALHRWIERHRTRENGLYWFEDTGSSGMDNSPRSGYYARNLDGSDVSFVDLACQQALAARCIASIAAHLGDTPLSLEMQGEHRRIAKLVNRYHWCDRHGFYYDTFSALPGRKPNFLNTKTAAAFWPLITGVADAMQAAALAEKLIDPNEFGTDHPVPTLSRSDANYNPLGGYWLGAVWAPVNYMVVRGLEACGFTALAQEITAKHLNAMVAVLNNPEYGSIWEAYSPEGLRPSSKYDLGSIVRNRFVGWSGLGPLAMLLETSLGVRLNASTGSIRWDIRMQGAHGVKRLKFCGGHVSLFSDGRHSVSVDAEKPFSLEISVASSTQAHRVNIRPGKHRIDLQKLFSQTPSGTSI
jgi:glycogen debranching enzyme